MQDCRRKRDSRPAAARGSDPPAQAGVLEALWAITGRGNNADVRRRDGRLVIYEVRKNIAAG